MTTASLNASLFGDAPKATCTRDRFDANRRARLHRYEPLTRQHQIGPLTNPSCTALSARLLQCARNKTTHGLDPPPLCFLFTLSYSSPDALAHAHQHTNTCCCRTGGAAGVGGSLAGVWPLMRANSCSRSGRASAFPPVTLPTRNANRWGKEKRKGGGVGRHTWRGACGHVSRVRVHLCQ